MTGLLPRSAFGEPIPRASGKKTVVCFSGGKDSVLALRALQQQGQYEAVALLTTVTSDYARVSMHGVRRSLLNQQARSLGLPLTEVAIPAGASNELYELRMARTLRQFPRRRCPLCCLWRHLSGGPPTVPRRAHGGVWPQLRVPDLAASNRTARTGFHPRWIQGHRGLRGPTAARSIACRSYVRPRVLGRAPKQR